MIAEQDFLYLMNLKNYPHHGNETVFDHSMRVWRWSLFFVNKFHLSVDLDVLEYGALLHDYFLYDWHALLLSDLHGFKHPLTASDNAKRDFDVSKDVCHVIETHMWPLTLFHIPKTKEALIVCLVDKFAAVWEVLKGRRDRWIYSHQM